MARASYRVDGLVDGKIYIIDTSDEAGTMSITNDAENVVKEVCERFGKLRIFYKDSSGEWGELVHYNGIFTHFSPYLPHDKIT